jgi:DNA-binding helix-hairpin-helix protein with protein kinase domain
MTVQTVTLELPSLLYDRVKRRAEQARRSIEMELLEAVATAVSPTEELPDDLAEAVASLALLDDETLRRAAASHFSAEQAAELEALHFKRQDVGWSESEARRAAELVQQYERAMLIRAQAMALLTQRGYDVSKLVTSE